MAYATTKLKLYHGGVIQEWVYDTADTLATVLGAGYISDAIAVSRAAVGRGMRPGDQVLVRRFTDVTDDTTFLGAYEMVVGSVNTTTGAATLFLKAGAGPFTCSIALAAGAANVCTITVTFKDQAGTTFAEPVHFLLYTATAATGQVLSTTSYSGTIAAVTGVILKEVTSKHLFDCMAGTGGIFVGSLTDTAKTAAEYIIVALPNGKIVASAALATGSYG